MMAAFLVSGSMRITSVGQVATQVPQPIQPLIRAMDIATSNTTRIVRPWPRFPMATARIKVVFNGGAAGLAGLPLG